MAFILQAYFKLIFADIYKINQFTDLSEEKILIRLIMQTDPCIELCLKISRLEGDDWELDIGVLQFDTRMALSIRFEAKRQKLKTAGSW